MFTNYSLSKLLYSIRPSACLGVALFASSAYGMHDYTIILIFTSTFLGSACCFLINDIFDRKKDLLNDKKRPIATGALPLNAAIWAAIITGLSYLLLAGFLGLATLIIAFITLFTFLTYSWINNRHGFIANLIVAIMVAISFVYGGILREIDEVLILILTSAFFVSISREIMLDISDMKGDQAVGKTSIPLQFSEKITKLFILSGYLLGSIPIFLLFNQPVNFELTFAILLSLWLPMLAFTKHPKWAMWNVRSSHIFFGFLILTLAIR